MLAQGVSTFLFVLHMRILEVDKLANFNVLTLALCNCFFFILHEGRTVDWSLQFITWIKRIISRAIV